MNIVFWFLVILAAVVVWFLGCFLFVPLGKYIYRIWKDAMEELDKDG